MMRPAHLLILPAALAALGLARPAAAQIALADADGDGRIARTEMAAMAQQRFQRFDQDGNGAVTEAEIAAVLATVFDAIDGDADGFLSRDEMRAKARDVRGLFQPAP